MISKLLAAGSALLAIAAATPVAAKEPATGAVVAPRIDFTEWVLANGLKVIAIPDQSTATVMTSVWYGVGAKHDPEGRSGFAHLFEHILSRKTVNMPYNMINRLTEDVGGVRNASTSADRTNYYEIVPAQYLETLLWTHAERMARPVVDTEVFERERSIVKEELRERVLTPPYGRLFRYALPENSFDRLPQRRSTIGSIAQLDSAKLDDARAFHQAYYGPDTATIIVAGNFDVATLKPLVERYFGAIPKRASAVPLAISSSEPPRTAPRRVNVTAPNVPLPVVGYSWKMPGSQARDTAALEVLDAVLSKGQNSRFQTALVRTGLATDAFQFHNISREGSYLAPLAIVAAGKEPDAVASALAAEIERVRSAPVTAAELLEAKNELLSDALKRRETASGRGFELGEALVLSGNPRSADTRLASIGKVTVADIQRVARRYLAPNSRLELRYTKGADDPAAYANPVPMPIYASVAPASGQPNVLREEAVREQPPLPGTAPAIAAPAIAQSRLANGVTVVSAKTGTVPVASLTVLLPGGSVSDPRDKAGIAQFAANLATKGTPTRSAEAIAATMESLGASLSATAGAEGSLLSVTAPVANLGAAGEVLADIVRNASFPDAEFQRERKRTLDGLTVALKDPSALASFALQPAMFGNAPYGTIAGGTVQSLPRLTRDDLAAHRQQWWHPALAKVIVSGGIDNAAAAALAGRLFGNWSVSGPAPTQISARAGTAGAPRTVVIDMPDAGQAAVFAAVRGAGRGEADYYPLLLANSVLGVGSNGRLFEEVRTKRALSYGAYSSLASRAEAGLLTASAQTKNESAADVAQVFLEQFARLGKEPITAEALEKRRLFLGGNTQRALETSSGFNSLVGQLLQQGLPPGEALQLAQRLGAVTPEAASQSAARYITPERTTLVIVGNAALFLDKLKALRPDVTVIKASEVDLSSPTLGAK